MAPAALTRHVVSAGRRASAFTLLEVVMAIAILAIVSVTLYQFVDTTLRAAAFSEKSGNEDAALGGLRRLVSAQLAALPANQSGALTGMNVTTKGRRRDALQLLCPAGNAVLTPDARGVYEITFDLRETPRGSGRYALGLERQPWTDDGDDDGEDDDKPAASALQTTDLRPGQGRASRPGDWIKLMDGVSSLEIAYFDARLNNWVDKWTDQTALPNLVRLRLGATERPEPYEMVLRVPGGGLKKINPTVAPGSLTFTNPFTAPNVPPKLPQTTRTSSQVGPRSPQASGPNTVLPSGFAVPTPPDTSVLGPRPNGSH